MKHTILCVDDEVDNLDALERIFRKKYSVLKAASAAEGLALLKDKPNVALIISDQRMPRKTGVEFLKESIETHPDTIRILLTGYTDIESVIEAINSGEIYRYITKPWDPVDLANTIDKAVEKFDLRAELKQKNAELQKAYDELKTLDEAKNNFMILINHELKTPLTVIISFLELMRETPLDDEQKKYVSRISSSADKLKRIIEDVLSFVAAETGIMKLNKRKMSTQKLLKGLAEKYAATAEKRGQSISISKGDHEIKADPEILTAALDRLIDNAIKFGDEKSEVEVEVQNLDSDNLEISVINHGKPLSKKTIDKIMKPFSLDEDILKHSQGLGLGLSLTQALLKRHSATFNIDCPKGRVRASFTISKE